MTGSPSKSLTSRCVFRRRPPILPLTTSDLIAPLPCPVVILRQSSQEAANGELEAQMKKLHDRAQSWATLLVATNPSGGARLPHTPHPAKRRKHSLQKVICTLQIQQRDSVEPLPQAAGQMAAPHTARHPSAPSGRPCKGYLPLVCPKVGAALISSWFNRWTTSRRFQDRSTSCCLCGAKNGTGFP